MTYFPTVPGGGVASYKLQPVFTYNNGYWEVYRRFQGDFFLVLGLGFREGAMWEDLSLEKYAMGEKIQWKGRRTNLVTLEKNVKLRA